MNEQERSDDPGGSRNTGGHRKQKMKGRELSTTEFPSWIDFRAAMQTKLKGEAEKIIHPIGISMKMDLGSAYTEK